MFSVFQAVSLVLLKTNSLKLKVLASNLNLFSKRLMKFLCSSFERIADNNPSLIGNDRNFELP